MSAFTHPPQQRIVSLPLSKLYPHGGHANRLSKAKFAKLVRHVQRTGQYEPLVVRRHPFTQGAYQILNGCYRARALKQIGCLYADCIIFKADDTQARLYLLSLNRLTGRDNVYKKAKLIEDLCRDGGSRDLAKWIPDSKTAIEKLNALSQDQPLPKTSDDKPLLVPMTFFMSPAQHERVAAAFKKANESSRGQRTETLVKITQAYLEQTERPQ